MFGMRGQLFARIAIGSYPFHLCAASSGACAFFANVIVLDFFVVTFFFFLQAEPWSVLYSLWVDGVAIADKSTTAAYIQNMNLSSHDRSARHNAIPIFFIECQKKSEGNEEVHDWVPYLDVLVDILRRAAIVGTVLYVNSTRCRDELLFVVHYLRFLSFSLFFFFSLSLSLVLFLSLSLSLSFSRSLFPSLSLSFSLSLSLSRSLVLSFSFSLSLCWLVGWYVAFCLFL